MEATTSIVIPGPVQLVVAGACLAIGWKAGSYIADVTADAVSAGLDKSGIRNKINAKIASFKKE